jgi:AraC-like DNA-binding protein
MQSIKIIALLVTIAITFFSGLQLLLGHGLKSRPKRLLGFFMLFSSFFYSSIAFYQTKAYEVFAFLDPLYMALMISFHPLFYLYVCSLISEKKKNATNLIHFIPAIVVFISTAAIYCTLSKANIMVYLKEYLFFEKTKPHNTLNILFGLYNADKVIHALQALIYFPLIIFKLKIHRGKVVQFFSNVGDKKLHWLRVGNVMLFIVSVNGIILNFFPLKALSLNDSLFATFIFSFALFYGILGTMGLQQQDIYTEQDEEPCREAEPGFSDVAGSDHQILNKLDDYMNNRMAYLKPDLKISHLCKDLDINRNQLSRYLNENLGMNFNTFINKYRVTNAKKMIREMHRNNHTLESIAFNTGFTSFTSFYRAFQSIEGITPGKYRKEILTKNNRRDIG